MITLSNLALKSIVDTPDAHNGDVWVTTCKALASEVLELRKGKACDYEGIKQGAALISKLQDRLAATEKVVELVRLAVDRGGPDARYFGEALDAHDKVVKGE